MITNRGNTINRGCKRSTFNVPMYLYSMELWKCGNWKQMCYELMIRLVDSGNWKLSKKDGE